MLGELCWGSYFEHLQGWQSHFGKPNLLVLKYEDMCADLKGCNLQLITFSKPFQKLLGNVTKIASFLGGRAEQIAADSAKLEQIVASSEFRTMKANTRALINSSP